MIKILCYLPVICFLTMFILAFFVLPTDHPLQNAEFIERLNRTIWPEILGTSSGFLIHLGFKK